MTKAGKLLLAQLDGRPGYVSREEITAIEVEAVAAERAAVEAKP